MRSRGTITTWNDDKGFGFITPREGEGRLFLHVSGLVRGLPRPKGAEPVSYEIALDRNQRPRAVNVRYERRAESSPGFAIAVSVSTGFIAFLCGCSGFWGVPMWIPLGYLGMSALTALIYRSDKSCAIRNEQQVPESTLHLLALLGGWPGALIAQWAFRHKNRKRTFQVVSWLIVAMHFSVWAWLLSYGAGWPTEKQSASRHAPPASNAEWILRLGLRVTSDAKPSPRRPRDVQ
jgi:uncharacterized membrane protein YsdA (DUF1294 family)/cold shock CspA family protein